MEIQGKNFKDLVWTLAHCHPEKVFNKKKRFQKIVIKKTKMKIKTMRRDLSSYAALIRDPNIRRYQVRCLRILSVWNKYKLFWLC